MGAPKGNKFWQLRSKHGRDKLFATPDLLWEAACEYFEWCEENPWYRKEAVKSGGLAGTIISVPTERPYTLQGLCRYLNCSTEYLKHFEANNIDSEDFMPIITRIREAIYQQKFEGASVGAFNANIIARDLGLADKQDVKVKSLNALESMTDEQLANELERLKGID